MKWKANDMPDLAGKLAIVTGANSGLGLETTRALAAKGAKVILACRGQAKAETAIAELTAGGIDRSLLEFRACDLSSLASVREFCGGFSRDHGQLDLLINNAGVMALPYRTTEDGFEMQIGTNHLGHFALTGLLLEPLLATAGARVVTVSSMAHRISGMKLDDLQSTRRYQKWVAYGRSKLANLLFTNELQRRLEASAADRQGVIAVAAHPGYSSTNLVFVGAQMTGNSVFERMSALGNRVIAQSAYMGALPTLYAATVADVSGGDYYGPGGPLEMTGYPRKVRAQDRAYDQASARRLWELSAELTGVSYAAL
ncbi:putative oxidoreductase/Short-chain dehydrogenase [Enhygromyxa salina]|uniref:Putative oxidoreductase/Short-chain dehydrogenase n=1 Tax=Enhygromyxa salina TaxID=215803 RepID=A0A0C2D3F8_9BACT|nr:putative oxidoreductase/Short-chain dehydrogenase [Enhygromyxa salina]